MSLYSKYYQEFTKDYTSYIPLAIIFQGCLGSIAVMLILMNEGTGFFPYVQLFIYVILCMLYSAAILAQLKDKIVFNLLLLSTLFNTLFIIMNLL